MGIFNRTFKPKNMKYQLFGTKTGLRVSELALGTSNFGTATEYGADPAEARRIWDGYVEAGGNFIDMSNAYQQGEAERWVGQFMGTSRGDFVLTSKYTRTENPTAALAQLGNHRKAMTQAVEASLKRLGTDYLDLYLVHLPDSVTPVAEIARGFEDLARAGKILYGGFSNFPAWRVAAAVTLAELRGWVPLAGIQVEYSLLQRTAERELLPMAEGLGLGVMGYSPLGGGVLTGKYRKGETGRASLLGVPTSSAPIDAILDVLLAIAQEVGAAPGQVATAWAMTRGIVPIIGARTRQQFDEQLGAAALTLSPEQLQRLAVASAVPLGYPHELLAGQQNLLTGNRADRVSWPARTVA
jgi:aryl-alcohol dehydrogenase-like predicted oxidoreductase